MCIRDSVEGDAALAAVQPNEMAADAVDVVVVGAGEIAVAGPLDLDHVGAHVRQMPRAQRRRHGVFQRDHAPRAPKRRLQKSAATVAMHNRLAILGYQEKMGRLSLIHI